MCIFNMHCQVTDGSCNCWLISSSSEVIKSMTIPSSIPNDQNMMEAIYRLLLQQSEIMNNIGNQIHDGLTKILEFVQRNQSIPESPTIQLPEATTPGGMMKFLCGNLCNHTLFLQLASQMPNPAYKERTFSIILNIIDSNGIKVKLNESLTFKIMLFTTDNPPKLLSINTSGDKIMRGTLEAEGKSIVIFKKIIIKEVTSHFRNGVFYFVVCPKEASFIRPFVHPDFVIKARKLHPDSPKKKVKIDNNDLYLEEDED
ncbi:hypothetical protein SteCoe_5874 [Stentor coeruleus]|uniref:Uncharacterized protein n=1 Tax=Stentor coeruleus TaxID=5963 RepID=A0A1R2CR91_9CILI|nr:hypothetical protein SteCoe_5874 [Stentor coeruleus]